MNQIMPPELLSGVIAEAQSYVRSLRHDLESMNGHFMPDVLTEMQRKAEILNGSAQVLQLDAVASLVQPVVDLLEACLQMGSAIADSDRADFAGWLDEMDSVMADLVGHNGASSSPYDVPAAAPQMDASAELLEIFALEASEHMQVIQDRLSYLHESPGDPEALRDIRRAAHTLKGASAAVGLDPVMRLSHLAEELLEQALDRETSLTPDALALLVDTEASLTDLLNPNTHTTTSETIASVDRRYLGILGDAYPFADEQHTITPPASPDTAVARALPSVEGVLRLPLASVDVLINQIGEVIINRARVEGNLLSLRTITQELGYSNRRLRRVAREIDAEIEKTGFGAVDAQNSGETIFDPIEMDRYSRLYQLVRELEEAVADTGDANQELIHRTDEMRGGMTRERRLTSEVQEHLIAARLVPFREIESRLRLTLQRAARDLHKEVNLTLIGFETTVDKNILDGLADPLMHLLRNAVDHGLELPKQREALGKPAAGSVTVRVARERNHIIVTISDDGDGIDFDRVRKRGVETEYLSPDEAADEQRLKQLIFEEGFSVSETVTETSGRGVGLNIVHRAVRTMQGTIQIDSLAGRGTAFIITVPVSLAITRTIYVRISGDLYAIPLDQIASVLRLQQETLEKATKDQILRLDSQMYNLYDLADFTGRSNEVVPQRRYGLVIQTGTDATLVLVDALAGVHETVVKSLGKHLRHVVGVTGATISAEGHVVLILDLMEVTGLAPTRLGTNMAGVLPGNRSKSDNLHVLVVDDSLSVRHVVGNFLERSGWQTSTAKDGIEALDKLAISHPDVALVDIEMPRMNGYELLTRIRNTPEFEDLPVVFLTSRAASKHRDRAMQLGADAYLVKPYRDEELLDTLAKAAKKHT